MKSNIIRRMVIAYNLVLIPVAIASLTIVYIGIKVKARPLLVTGIILTVLSPYLSYLVFKKVYRESGK